ncbi:hypothetical protein LXL04_005560 [Taraxacum kok-saghyz]
MDAAKSYISSLSASSSSAHLVNHGLVTIPFLSPFASLKELNLSGNTIDRSLCPKTQNTTTGHRFSKSAHLHIGACNLRHLRRLPPLIGNASPALLGDEPAGSVASRSVISIISIRANRDYKMVAKFGGFLMNKPYKGVEAREGVFGKRVSTKLSGEEREMLYKKWEIPVEGKQRRRLQM